MVQGTRGEEGREEEAEGEDQIERPRRDPNARHPFRGWVQKGKREVVRRCRKEQRILRELPTWNLLLLHQKYKSARPAERRGQRFGCICHP